MSRQVAQHFPRARRGIGRRTITALLIVPLLMGAFAGHVAAPRFAYADELSDAQKQQKALAAKIADEKAKIAALTASQSSLSGQIDQTKKQLNGITQNLAEAKAKVASLGKDLKRVQAQYDDLVASIASLDAQLADIVKQEADKRVQLGQHKIELAARIQTAYEDQRTSMLETLLSGASFTDMLAAMSTQLDAAAQDQQLAAQVASDQATLLSLHATVQDTRDQTNQMRQLAAVQRQALDKKLAALAAAQKKLKALEKAAKQMLASEKAQYAKMAANKTQLQRSMAKAAAARKALQRRIDRLIASQSNNGHIPSQYNGTLIWPMNGTVTQPYGCTGFSWEPPYGNCPHFHNGIDIVAPYGAPIHAAGAGEVVYVGWNYADGADPAWIVIIAHSSQLSTWYAHMQPRYPVRAGQHVSQGQVIGYEGSTGHSTGAHLHWMVEYNGSFVNPMLFT
ncbi:MAG: peptidoglycan DD-metalloendopeptidase family protein [Chloroflexota bacterium]